MTTATIGMTEAIRAYGAMCLGAGRARDIRARAPGKDNWKLWRGGLKELFALMRGPAGEAYEIACEIASERDTLGIGAEMESARRRMGDVNLGSVERIEAGVKALESAETLIYMWIAGRLG